MKRRERGTRYIHKYIDSYANKEDRTKTYHFRFCLYVTKSEHSEHIHESVYYSIPIQMIILSFLVYMLVSMGEMATNFANKNLITNLFIFITVTEFEYVLNLNEYCKKNSNKCYVKHMFTWVGSIKCRFLTN